MHRSLPPLLATAAVVIPAGGIWAATHATTQPATTARATSTAAAHKTATAAAHKTATAAAHKTATAAAHKTATAVARRTATARAAARKKATTHSYAGPSEDMQWGPVQVTIVVKNKKITDVRASAPTERARSAFINEQALPMLKQEVLQAQSANIDAIGGATMTSEAYYLSLQAALKAAHKAHAL